MPQPLNSDAEEVEVKWFYEDLKDLWELTPVCACVCVCVCVYIYI